MKTFEVNKGFTGFVFDDLVSKCFKVSSVKELDKFSAFKNDIVYVRNHPYVYMNIDKGDWRRFTKVYLDELDPKYNLNVINASHPLMFKIENTVDLNDAPAKVGDLLYRSGDSFMYLKQTTSGTTTYAKILKV